MFNFQLVYFLALEQTSVINIQLTDAFTLFLENVNLGRTWIQSRLSIQQKTLNDNINFITSSTQYDLLELFPSFASEDEFM